MSVANPLINGKLYSKSSAEVKLNGSRYTGFKAVDYKDKLTPGWAKGNQAERVGRTLGEQEADGSMEMYRDRFDTLINELGDGFGAVEFDIVVSYTEGGVTVTDTVEGCRIMEAGGGFTDSADPLTIKIPLSIHRVSWNGKYIAPRVSTQGAA